jgi:hypothetical protein
LASVLGRQLVGKRLLTTDLNEDMLKLFVLRLKADGDTVTYVALTDSTHAELGENGMEEPARRSRAKHSALGTASASIVRAHAIVAAEAPQPQPRR